jgi:hypothetical protein
MGWCFSEEAYFDDDLLEELGGGVANWMSVLWC